jgi:serine/threonine protein kinase
MATMFGRFEVQGELSKSDTALIYKVMDTEMNQVVALKTQSLAPLGDLADRFVDTLIREGESTRDLRCQNIVQLYGAGQIEGQFCAAMEYIQGNSIAGMLAHKEGFSIWDLLDITRQICSGLEHAAAKNVAHTSIEPAKIMVQWDGTVKILGYGISNMSLIEAEAGKSLGRLMPYCSPEQIRGEAIDLRSNLFTLGAILYEMVSGRKAFDATDPVALLNQIENDTPATPSSVNAKIQPGVSDVIMKALAKDPAERYQDARELLEELESCKENGKKLAGDGAATPAKLVAHSAVSAAATDKSVAVAASAGSAKSSLAPSSSVATKPSSLASVPIAGPMPAAVPQIGSNPSSKQGSKSGARLIGEFDVNAPEYQAARSAVMSAPPMLEEPERATPRVAVDPMVGEAVLTKAAMAKPAAAAPAGKSFSDLAEMPPLKDPLPPPPIYRATESAPSEANVHPGEHAGNEEKPRVQPREVAEKAIRQIVTVPPKLILFSIFGAVALILIIATAIFFHVRSEDSEVAGVAHPAKAEELSAPQAPVAEPVAPQIQTAVPAIEEVKPSLKVRQIKKGSAKAARPAPAPIAAAVIVPGEALIDSAPQGAQFQVDQTSDPSWVTPFTLKGLSPGKHIIAIAKAGYSSEVRSLDVVAGGKLALVLHLSPVNALVVVSSMPAGAEITIDGKPTGRVTPSQFAVEKGSHTMIVRKQGYLEETVTADLSPAQNFQFSPVLKALGDVSEMRTVGKLSKLFGRGGDSTVGMGTISVHTQPKGAQVAINQSILDKMSPVEVMLGPGNYVVDITLTGFKPVHKVVSVDKGGKAAIDEVLERR